MGRSKRTILIRGIGLLTLCTALAFLIGLFFLNRNGQDESAQNLVELLPLEADLTIAKVHQTATRNGIKEWRLDAESAEFYNNNRELVLNTIAMVFYLENRREVRLSADKGVLATESKDVQVEGNIVVKSDQARLETDRLNYNHENRLLQGNQPVEITGDAFYLEADRMWYDLNTNQSVFEGNVKGFFREDLPM